MDNIHTRMNCLQFCLYNICLKYNLDDFLIFTDVWKFSHDEEQLLSRSLAIHLDDEHSFLREYQGLVTEKISINNFNEFQMLNFVEKESVETEILICIDSYECHWHRGFEKIHIPHYVQVINIDYTKEIIICNDPQLNFNEMELPFTRYFYGCKTVRKIRNHFFKRKVTDIQRILSHIQKTTNIQQITGDIVSFAKRLLLMATKEDLFDYMDDVYLCSNVRNLKFIADSRYGLSYLFNNLGVTDDKRLIEIAKRFELCGSLFEKINHFYIKLYYRSSDLPMKLQSIYDVLIKIADIENDIFNTLSQVAQP